MEQETIIVAVAVVLALLIAGYFAVKLIRSNSDLGPSSGGRRNRDSNTTDRKRH